VFVCVHVWRCVCVCLVACFMLLLVVCCRLANKDIYIYECNQLARSRYAAASGADHIVIASRTSRRCADFLSSTGQYGGDWPRRKTPHRDPTSSTDCFRRLSKRTCSHVTSASSASGVLTIMHYTNPRTHSLTHIGTRTTLRATCAGKGRTHTTAGVQIPTNRGIFDGDISWPLHIMIGKVRGLCKTGSASAHNNKSLNCLNTNTYTHTAV